MKDTARAGAGRKAAATKGAAELGRAALMAVWTRRNGKDDALNPYSRQNYRPPVATLPSDATVPSPDPAEEADARRRMMRDIVAREGQGAFRGSLLVVYESVCAVTGCSEPQALEAAHIAPYLGEQTNVVNNGLLLRADIHTLFDKGLLTFDADASPPIILVAPSVRDADYRALHGRPMHFRYRGRTNPSGSSGVGFGGCR
jgi:predicted restriction endonuclease